MVKKQTTKSSENESVQNPFLHPEIRGFIYLVSAILMLISLISYASGHHAQNWLGFIGFSAGWSLYFIFGITSYLIPLGLGWMGWRLFFSKLINRPRLKMIAFWTIVISLSLLLNLSEDRYSAAAALRSQAVSHHLGGTPLYFIYHDLPFINLKSALNDIGVILICFGAIIASGLMLSKMRMSDLVHYLKTHLLSKKEEDCPDTSAAEDVTPEESDATRYVKLRIPSAPSSPTSQHTSETIPLPPYHPQQQDLLAIQPERNLTVRPSISRKPNDPSLYTIPMPPESVTRPSTVGISKKEQIGDKEESPQRKREAAIKAQRIHNGDFKDFDLPSLNLLTNAKKFDQTNLKKNLKKQAEVLEETLQSFGIEAKVGQINCGPTITSFEVHPAIGVKVQKIRTLENDIALNMEAKSIRIIAPIPGKAAVGIEVPNPQPQEVSFKEMLQAYQQGTQKLHIPVLLGKAVNGDYVLSDLAKMPHCIIAGATGSGKSVCINTIVMSIVMNAKPDQIKLMMVDPKKVELTPYSRLPHMLSPVITEPKSACSALNWLVKEMEKRYEILKQLGVRNIESFNSRTVNKSLEDSLEIDIPDKMFYIVGIIDELADLMMVASSDIETPIARIAQMARAVGIHLILATQRPSREVITGLIKANFPTRISFKVASRINSQIILDETGAESLLGNGDMLFLPPGTSQLVRAQGAFIRDDDINAVVKYLCDQAPPNYLIESFDRMTFDDSPPSAANKPSDVLYDQALQTILRTGNASTTFLQRTLKIGYARAASIVDELEANGVVGPPDGAKPRQILMTRPKGNSVLDSDNEESDIDEE